MIANCYLPLAREALEKTALGSFLLLGIYSDLTPGWYQSVGRSLLISQVSRTLRLVGHETRALKSVIKGHEALRCWAPGVTRAMKPGFATRA